MTDIPVLRALDTTVQMRASSMMSSVVRGAYADLGDPAATVAEHTVDVTRGLTRRWTTSIDGAPRKRAAGPDHALLLARRAINDLATGSVAATHTVLHASAFEVEGTVVVVAGTSTVGKSSLTLAATRAGHGYVADDVVAIDPEGFVRPYHRPLGVRIAEAPRLGVDVPPGPYADGYPLSMSTVGRLSEGGRIGLLVQAGRGEATFTTPLEPSWALMLLANNAVRAQGHERVMFRRLGQLVRSVPVVHLDHHDYDSAVESIELELRSLGAKS